MLTRPLVALMLGLTLGATSARAADFPLAGSKISLKDGEPSKRRVTFQARFSGDLGAMDPNDGSTLRVTGGPGEGDTGLISLGPNWRTLPKGKGFRYVDKTRSAGGVESILLRKGKNGGGRLKLVGGNANWAYTVEKAQTVVTVTLTIADAKLCAQFSTPKTKKQRVTGQAPQALDACPCETFDSTWHAIQKIIFENRGCTDQLCHGSVEGAATSGGLNLSPDVAFANLVNVYSEQGKMDRVEPGSPTNDSFLYRKLAAKTLGLDIGGDAGTPMPSGLPAISVDELEALRLWIQYSAQEEGVVAGTEGLLNSCLPPAKPPHLDPPAPPAAGQGVQYFAHPWPIAPKAEDEGCYATYEDVTAQVPTEFLIQCPPFWGGDTKNCYGFNKSELTQEPNSHHSIIHIYRGKFAESAGFFCEGTHDVDGLPLACNPSSPGVPAPDGADCGAGSECVNGFDFKCGGIAAGTPCDPRVPGVCGEGAKCLGVYKSSLACLTFGPPDFTDFNGAINGTGGSNSPQVGGSQQPFSRTDYPDGVFGVYPTKALWVWNSHAFNLTDEATYNQQWLNVYFASPSEQVYPIRGVFDADDIFVQDVPPFEEREYCRTITFGKGTRLSELSSHTHSRARLFRTWAPPIAPRCRSTQANPGACVAEAGTPLAVTTQYNDPTQYRFGGVPLPLDSDDPAERTFKFCALFDNGHTDPAEVKRNSQSPIPPTFGVLAPGGPCLTSGFVERDLGIACLNGPRRGEPCEGDAPGFQADDRKCDSAPGANDGICDACPLRGGVTTADEMFIPLGNYYCDPSVPGESCTYGMCDGGPNWGKPCDSDGDSDECGGGARCQAYIN
jgi:hypothetical protein